jgi:hypothetical protein
MDGGVENHKKFSPLVEPSAQRFTAKIPAVEPENFFSLSNLYAFLFSPQER